MSAPAHAPRVTVLTTVYNGEQYLEETIESIVGQPFTDFEYVVVDDGSTDATAEILEKRASRDPRLVVLRNPVNIGIPASANRGLSAARGDYVARIDADDVSEPDRLRLQVDTLDARPDVVMVSMNYYLMHSDGRLLRRTNFDAPPEAVEFLLHFGNAVGGHSQVMFRRSAVLAIGGYDESQPFALDYDLWTRLMRVGRILILPQPGMRYRLHDRSVTSTSRQRQRAIAAAITRRMLSGYLGRELSERETSAVSSLWSQVPPSADPGTAEALLREAFARFTVAPGTTPEARRRVRREFAARFVGMGMALLWSGHGRAAVRHLLTAARWDAPHAGVTLWRQIGYALQDQWRKLADPGLRD